MASESKCKSCQQSLVNGSCVNLDCEQYANISGAAHGSLVPDELMSIDPSQIVDYTGTIGVMPGEFDSVRAMDSIVRDSDVDSAQTRMVDDNFYRQVQTFFPADSGSKSASADSKSRESEPDASLSLYIQGVRDHYSLEEFVPPVREIQFPADDASLKQNRAAKSDLLDGDEYYVVDKLGEGGYGVVFEAEQIALNRPVAVKVLKPNRKPRESKSSKGSGSGTGELQRRRDQFLHEAKITARLQHPNIVPLYDFGINPSGELFYSMKKVERRPWSKLINSPERLLEIRKEDLNERTLRSSISRNIEVFARVCEAMAYSHSMKIIHRDLKPDNIMIGSYGEVLLIDFGMALDLGNINREFSAGGTLVYMAPEMALHFAKQKEIQVAAQKTAKMLGEEDGSVFLDRSNLVGIGSLAQRLINESTDEGVAELAQSLIRLHKEEKQLAAKISYTSDIYLLGAILYQIAVGHPPHYFPAAACKNGRKEKFQKELWLAIRNGFQQYNKIADPLRLSLRSIAVRAMRTDPANRFQSVEELQEAIRDFQSQVQSLEMTETGKEELEKSKNGEDYQHLLPALESFRGARALWPESNEAKTLQIETACEYAGRANRRADYDAGLSILDEYAFDDQQDSRPVAKLRKKLVDGKRRRNRNRRLAAVGWIAAVTLPIIVFVSSAIGTARIQREADQYSEVAKQQREIAVAQTEVASAKAQEATRATSLAEEKAREAETATVMAEEAEKLATEKTKEAAAATMLVEKKTKEAENASKLALSKTKEAEAATKLAVTKTEEAETAAKRADQQRALAEKFQFASDFSVYNSNVLTVPLDIRTAKLDVARDKLQRLKNSTAKEYFKNGWLVKHFEKELNISGINQKLGKEASVINIVALPNSDRSLVAGLERGKPTLWSFSAAGESKRLKITPPNYGTISDASISSDGQWLAVSLNDIDAADQSQHPLWIANLNTGEIAELENSKGVVGSRAVAFSQSGNQLVTVEELSGEMGLKKRIRVVTRAFNSGSLSDATAVALRATARDEGRVRYRASATSSYGKPVVAIAFQSLDAKGNEIFQMQTVVDGVVKKAITIDRFPTAMLASGEGRLYCGHVDGQVEQFDISQLSNQPVRLENRNENRVVKFALTPKRQLISGSQNGSLIFWNPDLTFNKRLAGQPSRLSALAVGQSNPNVGYTLFSGDTGGDVRVWKPETNQHQSTIDKKSVVRVTCGAIDKCLKAAAVPGTVFGTSKGQVYYFNSDAMISRDSRQEVGNSNVGAATFGFDSPFESFDIAFDNFDSMGIVQDHFVLMQDNGTFYSSFIHTKDQRKTNASSRVQKVDLNSSAHTDVDRGLVNTTFTPLLASVHNKDYFFTTDPKADDRLIFWTVSGSKFTHQTSVTAGANRGRIKRLKMSADGRWLAVVKQIGQTRSTGEYKTEIFDVSSGSPSISLVSETSRYRVGDPAFVDFSDDSQSMILNFHKLGVDRETWIEQWNYDGQSWNESGTKRFIDDRKVELVDWSGDVATEELVTKVNKRFYLAKRDTTISSVKEETRPDFDRDDFVIAKPQTSDKLRSVRYAGNDNYYFVLSSDRLSLYDGTKSIKTAEFPSIVKPIENARDLRVFGDRAVLLDKNGFHLINSDLTYVQKLADRQVEVKALSLSSGRLAVLYSNGLCRVWDVRGEMPQGIGKVENAESVTVSPDGKWVACQVEQSVDVFNITSVFAEPKTKTPYSGGAFHWTGKEKSELLFAIKGDGIKWQQLDPANGQTRVRGDLPKDVSGLVDFTLAPETENFIAIKTDAGDAGKLMSLWATGVEPIRLNKTEHGFDETAIRKIQSITFSEIHQTDPEAIGTRLVVLSSDGSGINPEPRIFLLADEDPPKGSDEVGEKRYRAIEIDGALESTEGIELIDAQFSGDGRSLLEVHARGTATLLSQ